MQVENCSKFWLQPKSEKEIVKFFNLELNNKDTKIIKQCINTSNIQPSEIIAARDYNNDKLYRARFISWDYDDIRKSYKGNVQFIDYGRTQQCDIKDLYTFTERTEQEGASPRAFECKLAEIQASTANLSGGFKWDAQAIELFKSFVLEREVKAQVHFET